jgi:hypothetical protein
VDPTEEPETKSSYASETTALQIASKTKLFDQFRDMKTSKPPYFQMPTIQEIKIQM